MVTLICAGELVFAAFNYKLVNCYLVRLLASGVSLCLYCRIQALVYPSKGAISIEEFISRNGPIERFVFLDATWFQVFIFLF